MPAGNVGVNRTGWDQLWKANMAQPADQAEQRDNMEADFGEPGAGASIESLPRQMVVHPCATRRGSPRA